MNEFKNSTEMNQYYRAMMSDEAQEEEDLVAFITMGVKFVLSFLLLLTLSLGVMFIIV